MKKIFSILILPFVAILLLFAAIVEPTVGGEIAWIWWILGSLGLLSLAGWILEKGRRL